MLISSSKAAGSPAEGSSAIFVFALIVPIIFTTILAILVNLHARVDKTARKFVAEFIILVYTIVFNVTILNQYIAGVVLFLGIFSLLLVLISLIRWAVSSDVEHDPANHSKLSSFKAVIHRIVHKASSVEIQAVHPGYVTMLRATVNLITAVCILAVDFNIFPIYLYKTHRYGFSLMDTGIGLFVFSIAVVSGKPASGHFKSMRNLLRLLWNVFPFIVLGVGRAVIIKQIDYNQGVTEYGKHWNAFLTLGVTKFFATLIASVVPKPKHLHYAAIVILGLHETALQFGLADFVMDRSTGRDNVFTANREGIISIPGFVALHLASMYLGYLLKSSSERMPVRRVLAKVLVFGMMSIALWPAVLQIESMFGVSRRICNMGYVMWMLCIATSMAALYMLVELFAAIMAQHKAKDRNWTYIPIIMQAINFNGLGFFLLANVLTGMVNMTFKTRKMDTLHSLLILMGYMLTICLVTTIFYVNKLRVKFW